MSTYLYFSVIAFISTLFVTISDFSHNNDVYSPQKADNTQIKKEVDEKTDDRQTKLRKKLNQQTEKERKWMPVIYKKAKVNAR